MRKNLFTLLGAALLAGSLPVLAGKPVPYVSDFYVNYSLDEGWTVDNGNRSASGWECDNEGMSRTFWAEIGAEGGAKKAYDWTYAADAWLLSPAITVEAGKTYTVSIWARCDSRSTYERESFKVTMAGEGTMIAQKAGTILINQPSYLNKGSYEEFTGTFTATSDGDVYFGVNCYSAADQYTLFVSHFSVTEGEGGSGGGDTGGGGEVDPDDPGTDPQPGGDVTAKALPFTFDFGDSSVFNAEWTSLAGPEADSQDPWSYWYGSAQFEAPYMKEDNWLISPPINFSEAGVYSISTIIEAEGKVEVAIGTDPTDASSFTKVLQTKNDGGSSYDDPVKTYFSMETAGVYYIGFHACADYGPYWGEKVDYVQVQSEQPIPGPVTDFTALADAMDGLSVSLSWTYPAQDQLGNPLGTITKAELYRNSTLLHTFTDAVPGQFTGYLDDAIPAAGNYSYILRVYNENGYNTDADSKVANAGYVGKPIVDGVPYWWMGNYDYYDDYQKFTIEDGNDDGITWYFEPGYYSGGNFNSMMPDVTMNMDDYIATPYVPITPGTYEISYHTGGMHMNYEVGYATNRHDIKNTFVPLKDVQNDPNYSATNHVVMHTFDTAGDYVFVVHHYGNNNGSGSWYYNMTFENFSIYKNVILPEVATDLEVVGSTENAVITWTNPTLNSNGEALASITKAVILRNGATLATIENSASTPLQPGQRCEYTDNSVTEGGEYTYSVEIYNENGKSTSPAPSCTVYVGRGRSVPFTAETFTDWKVIDNDDDYYEWSGGYAYLYYNKYYGATADDYALSPYIELKAGLVYTVKVTTSASSEDFDINFVAGSDYEPSALQTYGTIHHNDDELESTFFFRAVNAGDELNGRAVERPEIMNIEAGKATFGVHLTVPGEGVYLSAFSIELNKELGTETVMAQNGMLTYADGMVRTATVADSISVYTIDGRMLATAYGSDVMSLEGFDGQMVVIVAMINGQKHTLKVNL